MMPPEFQLLLYCVRSPPAARSIKHLINAGGAIDWTKVLQLAEQHGVRPMLLQSLKAVCWDAIPAPTQLELERFYRANAQKNFLFAVKLLRVIGECKKNHIPSVPIKGPVLAQALYGDLSLREFCDLDVLVPEEHV